MHIPFCIQKCNYCDFHSIPHETDGFVGCYLSALEKEIQSYARVVKDTVFDSVYIGGGTPTILPVHGLKTLLSAITSSFHIRPDAEITMEGNPRTLTDEKANTIMESGVNRVSLGAQAFQDRLLSRLGRAHDVEDIFESVSILRRAGLKNLNLDLIYGLPGQTVTDWQHSLDQALSLSPEHLSCYTLIIEPGTPFAHKYAAGDLEMPGEDEEEGMYLALEERLSMAGFHRYEISNYALPGWQSRHNLLYWLNQPYLGLGSGAHGNWEGVRYANFSDIAQYMKCVNGDILPIDEQALVTKEQAMDETMMLGMRLLRGVPEKAFVDRYAISYFEVYGDEIAKLLEKGLVEFAGGALKLTARGLLLGNLVFAEFVRLPLDK